MLQSARTTIQIIINHLLNPVRNESSFFFCNVGCYVNPACATTVVTTIYMIATFPFARQTTLLFHRQESHQIDSSRRDERGHCATRTRRRAWEDRRRGGREQGLVRPNGFNCSCFQSLIGDHASASRFHLRRLISDQRKETCYALKLSPISRLWCHSSSIREVIKQLGDVSREWKIG
ncbi:hypothetical protein C8J56DRAFT_512513 [Mycena floridula]|nr:hypothetical protein C8J56DRAFT_512513 [Mycena floridula]